MQYYTKNFYVGELDWTYAVRLSLLPLASCRADDCSHSAEGWRLPYQLLRYCGVDALFGLDDLERVWPW